MSWDAVVAPGTDPAVVARVVALSTDAGGRAALAAALAAEDGLFGELAAIGDGVLPTPTSGQRRAAEEACTWWRARSVRLVLRGDDAWPRRLGRVSAPPLLLAWRGPDRLPDAPTVAVVGARRATSYGAGVAAWLAEAAATAGATVVSGGARGIDAAAHAAAVEDGTVVVLGCGHGVAYPRPHAGPGGLFDRVLAGGGAIVSELLPDAPPRPHNVRARNRIVAGLADVVVVVEGREGSGSLLTAGVAADAGIPVLAVPGDVRAAGSAAPHQLLREGATPCTGPDDLLDALRLEQTASAGATPGGTGVSALPAPLAAVLVAAWPRAVRTEELAARSGLGIGAVLAAVTRARIVREVVETSEGVRLSRPRPPTRG